MTYLSDPPPQSLPQAERIPPLVNGDHLTQPEFHRRYEAMPPDTRAELIGGIVYMPSPMRTPHGRHGYLVNAVLALYEASTPGVFGAQGVTTILGTDCEPQPDLILCIDSKLGGQAYVNSDDYLVGPPELVIEVAHSTVAIDLGAKRRDYQRSGVQEYLVFCVEDRTLRAFDLPANAALPVPKDGTYLSKAFGGLWINVPAVFQEDAVPLFKTLQLGLASDEHRAFVQRLAAAKKP